MVGHHCLVYNYTRFLCSVGYKKEHAVGKFLESPLILQPTKINRRQLFYCAALSLAGLPNPFGFVVRLRVGLARGTRGTASLAAATAY